MKQLKVKKLRPDAKMPTYGTPYAAGIDFYTPCYTLIKAGRTVAVPLGIAVSIPHGYGLIFKEKSSIALKTDLIIRAGVIDSDYRGELKVMYYNAGDEDFYFDVDQKVVQGLVIEIEPLEVQEVEELDYTDRNDKGFGSTGSF